MGGFGSGKRKPIGEKYRTIHTLVCADCGDIYQSIDKRRKFCSLSCANKFHAQQQRRSLCICKFCGREYVPKAKDRIIYCSRECYFANKKAVGAVQTARSREVKEVSRKAARQRMCAVCGKRYEARSGVYCSDECRKEIHRRKDLERQISNYEPKQFKCKECGKLCDTEYGDKRKRFCSDTCALRYIRKGENYKNSKRDANHRRRARKHSARIERFKSIDIYNRDGWICCLCGGSIDKKLKFPHLDSATVDHIIPFALGGSHTMLNCQSAHLICNSYKRDLIIDRGGVKIAGAN